MDYVKGNFHFTQLGFFINQKSRARIMKVKKEISKVNDASKRNIITVVKLLTHQQACRKYLRNSLLLNRSYEAIT